MEIKLLPSPAEQIARDILSGNLPPETYDLEVISCLFDLDPDLSCYCLDDKYGKVQRVDYDREDVRICLVQNVEMRGDKNFDDSEIGRVTKEA